MIPPLVPLRIPAGWKISFNQFTESNPELFIDDEYIYRWEFNEDIFQFENSYRKRILDLSWRPEFNPNGEYILVLLDADFPDWSQPLSEFRTKEIKKIIEKTEQWLAEVSKGG
ncbi:hypothetical protein [Paenibacillus sp. FSL R7-0331]|uniref:hypothetical protein n=1 Tax=Paenibacillus sp. FSL R7-0331 TaxID=1536773 RepID=UPI0004F6526D|nr:hypothetical protein [Paenibacillus sp. FSL R7-0331]AIQ53398.1 hypothetical protein R70331_18880 [Paenibacillus sp. FSL R7-0331]